VASYRLSFTASAEKELRGLPAKMVARIAARVERLGSVPRPTGCKKLVGGDKEWRIRIGDYRVVYEIDDAAKTVDVTADRASPRSLRIEHGTIGIDQVPQHGQNDS
jgi:mRNA interferase RelE/StbE